MTQTQLTLFNIEVEKDINGIKMGVLENGIPYLTQTGLAAIAGVNQSVISDISKEWEESYNEGISSKGRIIYLQDKLLNADFQSELLYIPVKGKDYYAYPVEVCMAILEYYAYESSSKNETAINSFRKLALLGLKKFIFKGLGYVPVDPWKYYHDRVSVLHNRVQPGFFSIFEATGGLIVDLIKADVLLTDKIIPDISVGITWRNHWNDNDLENTYGVSIEYEHVYPGIYRQSASNSQPAHAYPDAAFPEFRRWFREEYLPTKFPPYILKKANLLPGGKEQAKAIGDMYKPKKLKP